MDVDYEQFATFAVGNLNGDLDLDYAQPTYSMSASEDLELGG